MMPKPIVWFLEDDPSDIFLIGRAIVRNKIRVHTCFFHEFGDFRQRLQQVVDSGGPGLPDLIVTDLKLRGFSGFEAIAWMQKSPTLAKIRIIVLSSSDLEADKRRAADLGVRAFLTKSAGGDELANALKEIFEVVLPTAVH